jgi:hypothetical protein
LDVGLTTSHPKKQVCYENNSNKRTFDSKRRMNSDIACYHSVQSLFSSRLLLKSVKIKIYKTIILPVVLYGCETWSLALMEEHRLVFEKRVLRIFGPKRDEVTGGSRKLHIEHLCDLYSLSSIIRMIRLKR